jgi:hypothetical protein
MVLGVGAILAPALAYGQSVISEPFSRPFIAPLPLGDFADPVLPVEGEAIIAPQTAAPPPVAPPPAAPRLHSVAARILAAHNAERQKFGAPALEWDDGLAQEAEQWAVGLARSGQLEHSSAQIRHGAGENLFMGTAGAYRVEAMIDFFLEERRDFQPGTFPNVARNGDWSSVGHYTQIIWRDTRRVGCGLATANGNEAMVCRYVPAGNIYGDVVP